MQSAFVHAALEVNDLLDRIPVVRPTPLGKFRLGGGIEPKRRFVIARAQQIPALFLAYAKWQLLTSLKSRWQAIA
jgi:hypothetical protein